MSTVFSVGAVVCLLWFGTIGYGTGVAILLAPVWIYAGAAVMLGALLLTTPPEYEAVVERDAREPSTARVALVVRAPPAECAICLAHAEAPVALACGHAFHAACVAAWLERKPTCPLCRARATMR
jgi:hypothetical protein